MAEVIQDIDGEVGEFEAVAKIQQQQELKPEYQLPDRYRGKSVEDVVKMHGEAEKLIARQAQEVGEVRKLADELIKSQLSTKPKEETSEEIDFFENPKEAVRRAVETNPDLVQAKQFAQEARQEQAKLKLIQMHPDFSTVVGDTGFQDWVKSSRFRSQLFNQAESYDVDAAHELLSTYKALNAGKQQQAAGQMAQSDNATRTRQVSAASVDVGGSGDMSKKSFRRADLIRLKMRDPNKYEAMQDEIMAAYAEDRVR